MGTQRLHQVAFASFSPPSSSSSFVLLQARARVCTKSRLLQFPLSCHRSSGMNRLLRESNVIGPIMWDWEIRPTFIERFILTGREYSSRFFRLGVEGQGLGPGHRIDGLEFKIHLLSYCRVVPEFCKYYILAQTLKTCDVSKFLPKTCDIALHQFMWMKNGQTPNNILKQALTNKRD